MKRLLVGVALVLVGAGAGVAGFRLATAEDSHCAEARALHDEYSVEVDRRVAAVTTTTPRQWVDAEAVRAARASIRQWAVVVEQNPDCFSVEERADADTAYRAWTEDH